MLCINCDAPIPADTDPEYAVCGDRFAEESAPSAEELAHPGGCGCSPMTACARHA